MVISPAGNRSLPKCRGNNSLRWRHNGRVGVPNHQPQDCLLNRSFRRKSKKTSKLRVTGLCAVNSPVTREFPAQMASNAQNVFIWWRHHAWRIWIEKTHAKSHQNAYPNKVHLNSENRYDAKFIVPGGTDGCHIDNFWCHRRRLNGARTTHDFLR